MRLLWVRQVVAKREHDRQDRAWASTTVFDFAWRMRTRSNEVTGRCATSAPFLFEALIATRARGVLEDAAVHFVSRDSSTLADQLIAPRLKALGLLAQHKPSS